MELFDQVLNYDPTVRFIREGNAVVGEIVYPSPFEETKEVYSYESPHNALMSIFDGLKEGRNIERDVFQFFLDDTQPVAINTTEKESTGRTFSIVENSIFAANKFDHYVAPSEGTVYRASNNGVKEMSLVFIETGEETDEEKSYQERVIDAARNEKIAYRVTRRQWNHMPKGRLYLGANGHRVNQVGGEAVGIEMNPYMAADAGVALQSVDESEDVIHVSYMRNYRVANFDYYKRPDYWRYPGDVFTTKSKLNQLFNVVSSYPLRSTNPEMLPVRLSKTLGVGLTFGKMWDRVDYARTKDYGVVHVGYKGDEPVAILDRLSLDFRLMMFKDIFGHAMPEGNEVAYSLTTLGYAVCRGQNTGYNKIDLKMTGNWYYNGEWKFYLGEHPLDSRTGLARRDIKYMHYPNYPFISEELCVTGFIQATKDTTYVYTPGGDLPMSVIPTRAKVESEFVSYVGLFSQSVNKLAISSYEVAKRTAEGDFGLITVVKCKSPAAAKAYLEANKFVFQQIWYGNAINGDNLYGMIFDGKDKMLTEIDYAIPVELYRNMTLQDCMQLYARFERCGGYIHEVPVEGIEFEYDDDGIVII